MNNHGFVEEDDLILYAMQALSAGEMEQLARRLRAEPELRARLGQIESVLGVYASSTVEAEDVPGAALDRLLTAVATERPVAAVNSGAAVSAAAPGSGRRVNSDHEVRDAWTAGAVAKVPAEKASWGWRWGLLWGGWAVAAALLVGLGLEFRQGQRAQQNMASTETSLRTAQSQANDAAAQASAAAAQATAAAAERDRLQSSLQQQSGDLQATQKAAADARNQSANLNAKVAGSNLRAEREAARADALQAEARENAAAAQQAGAARSQLNEALTREQQTAAQAAESQQVLAALADPAALHVTLTVPKQKKRPSGRGTYVASNGTLVFTGSDLGPLPSGKVYELWLMPADGSAPIPAGTFSPDASGNATLISSRFQRGVAAKGFAITAENAGGSLKPTLPILLAGGV